MTQKNKNAVCMDIVDTVRKQRDIFLYTLVLFFLKMNYTRLLWSKIYECRRHDPDYMAVIGISFFIPTIVFVFYVSAVFKGNNSHN
jgi:hypothetical protein